MKMNKLLISVFMLAVMFSLAGCNNESKKPFEYDETQIVLDTMSYFETYNNVNDEYSDYYISDGTAFEQSAVKGIIQAQETDKVGEFQDFTTVSNFGNATLFDIELVEANIENGDDYVMVTVINDAENRDVEVSVKYVENPEYYIEVDKIVSAYTVESVTDEVNYLMSLYGITLEDVLAQNDCSSIEELVEVCVETEIDNLSSEGILPYIPEEMVVTAVYSTSELMGQAGMNTLIGMGTVFIVLIFISFIISLFKYLPALFAKKPKIEPEKKTETPKAAPAPVAKNENLADDAQLVAVITAAIYAYEAQSGNGAVSKDKLVVRSIKRVRK